LKGFFISLITMTESATLDHIYSCYLESSEVSTDTRKLTSGCFFVALKGDNFDGNKFAVQAFEAGAAFVLMDDQEEFSSAPLDPFRDRTLLVQDSLTALQNLATHHRRALELPILALTGSNGKTTTKELLHATLSQKFNCLATLGNLNNHIGVPLTLLRMDQTTQLGIVEMGANHQGEIALLCRIAEPNYGYITNFGKAHLEGFGGLEGVIKGKSELIDYLSNTNGRMFVQSTDSEQLKRTKDMPRTILNVNQQWEVIAESDSNKTNSLGDTSLDTLALSGPDGIVHTQLIGQYNTQNVIAAAEIGQYFDVSWKEIKSSLEQYTPRMNRSQGMKRGPYNLIMDAYNANPSSMQQALDHFAKTNASGFKAVILGDMFELGQEADLEHQTIVAKAEHLGFDQIYLAGLNFSRTEFDHKQTLCFSDYKALEQYLLSNPPKHGSIMIKGSRGMALERLLNTVFRG
jgi:UDP-N-acetylmuramoyl-tripeptide--D-alanyl-D-alanine ligase